MSSSAMPAPTPPAAAAPVPTASDLQHLGKAIANDGVAQHVDALQEIGAITQHAGLLPGATEALLDTDAPEVLRLRAFATISRHWEQIVAAVPEPVLFDLAFRAFIAQWTSHQDPGRELNLEALWNSRSRLDNLADETVRYAAP